MQLTLEIKNASDWEILLTFLMQQGIDFRLSGKKSDAIGKIKMVPQKQNRLQLVAHMKGVLEDFQPSGANLPNNISGGRNFFPAENCILFQIFY